jgi:chromosome segregation ATPase
MEQHGVLEAIIATQEAVASELESYRKTLDQTLRYLDELQAELSDVERGYRETEEPFLRHFKAALKTEITLREFTIRYTRRAITNLNEQMKHLTKSLDEYDKIPDDLRQHLEKVVTLVPTNDLTVN